MFHATTAAATNAAPSQIQKVFAAGARARFALRSKSSVAYGSSAATIQLQAGIPDESYAIPQRATSAASVPGTSSSAPPARIGARSARRPPSAPSTPIRNAARLTAPHIAAR